MTMILFTLAGGGGIAIDEEEVSALWEGKEKGTTMVERMSGDLITVIGEYDKITEALFDSADMRPKRPKKKRTKADAKYKHPYDPVSNLVELDAHRRDQSR